MSPDVCVANIGHEQRRRRRRSGLVGLVLGGAVLAGGPVLGLSPAVVALAGAGALFGGFVGVFQARGKT